MAANKKYLLLKSTSKKYLFCLQKVPFMLKWEYLAKYGSDCMREVQLKVTISSTVKDEAALKAKAEHKTMKQLIEELLIDYVRGNKDQAQTTQITHPPNLPKPKADTNVSPDDFSTYMEYVDYLERNGMLYWRTIAKKFPPYLALSVYRTI